MRPRIHDRYLLRQFIRILIYSIAAFTVIYITVDVFEEIDNFIDHEAQLGHIALYYVYSLPFILTYIIPVSLLLGSVFSMGVMARRNELTALIASGVSLVRVAAPIITVAVLMSIASAWFNDVVVADANQHRDDIMEYEIEGRIGSGGMGVVQRVDDRDLRRQIAMRVIRPAMAKEKEHCVSSWRRRRPRAGSSVRGSRRSTASGSRRPVGSGSR